MSALSTFRTELPVLGNGHSATGSCSPSLPLTTDGRRTISLNEFFQRIGYVTLKLTNGCNLSCAYCNVEADTPKTPRMSIERFKQVARLLLVNTKQSSVGLEFHGGEPLLLADEFFEEAVAYARALAREHSKIVEFPLVTNGTLLTEERLLKLNRLGISWCMSVDGPPEIHDQARGSGRAVERAIGLFRKHGIHFGVLTVMSRANYNRMGEVMDWFDSVGINDFRINFLEPQGRGNDDELVLTGPEMFEGMKQIVEHMVRTGLKVNEAEITQIVMRYQIGRNPNPALTCWELECQAGRIYVAIDHNGYIHACGTDLKNHILGHLDQDLDLDHYDRILRRLHAKDDWLIRCFDCDARKICRHSCSTSDFNSKVYREYECDYTKRLYSWLRKNPEKPRIIEAILASRIMGIPPGAAFVPVETIRVL